MDLNSSHKGYYLKMKTVAAIGTVDMCKLHTADGIHIKYHSAVLHL